MGPDPSSEDRGVSLAFDHNPNDPPSCTGRIDDKIQSATIAMPPSAQILDQLLG